jgi:hypothetical protein
VTAAAPLGRAWRWLAALALLAAALGLPYERALSPHAHAPTASLGVAVLARALTALCVVAPLAWAGLWLGRPLGWGAPLLAGGGAVHVGDAAAPGRRRAAWRTLAVGLFAGVVLGFALEALDPLVLRAATDLARLRGAAAMAPPAWTGILGAFAAAVNEEVVFRLFLLTLLARAGFALTRGDATSRLAVTWGATALAALVFGASHFTNVKALGQPFTFPVLALVLVWNGALGLLCGRLYTTRGIETAMAAHAGTDLVLHALAPALSAMR